MILTIFILTVLAIYAVTELRTEYLRQRDEEYWRGFCRENNRRASRRVVRKPSNFEA